MALLAEETTLTLASVASLHITLVITWDSAATLFLKKGILGVSSNIVLTSLPLQSLTAGDRHEVTA